MVSKDIHLSIVQWRHDVLLVVSCDFCVYYPSNIFHKLQDLLQIGEYHLEIPYF